MIILKALSLVLGWLPFFYWTCNSGEHVATSFSKMDDSIYNISWHLYPSSLQKYFILIIMMAHRPVYIRGYAWITCSRETFKLVDFEMLKSFELNAVSCFWICFDLCPIDFLILDNKHGLSIFHDASSAVLMGCRCNLCLLQLCTVPIWFDFRFFLWSRDTCYWRFRLCFDDI